MSVKDKIAMWNRMSEPVSSTAHTIMQPSFLTKKNSSEQQPAPLKQKIQSHQEQSNTSTSVNNSQFAVETDSIIKPSQAKKKWDNLFTNNPNPFQAPNMNKPIKKQEKKEEETIPDTNEPIQKPTAIIEQNNPRQSVKEKAQRLNTFFIKKQQQQKEKVLQVCLDLQQENDRVEQQQGQQQEKEQEQVQQKHEENIHKQEQNHEKPLQIRNPAKGKRNLGDFSDDD